jgi:hypothetical protein
MPDFDTQVFWHCSTSESWEKEVQGKSGTYTVRFGRGSLNHDVQHDFSCTCWAYKKGKGKYCKHIEQVKSEHCGWNQFIDGEEPVQRDGEYFCPRCGEPAFPLRYAV